MNRASLLLAALSLAALSLAALSLACVASLALAAPNAEQRNQAKQLEIALRKAGSLYTQGKFKESGEVLTQVQAEFDKLAAEGDHEMLGLLSDIYPRLLRAHALVELEGVRLPRLNQPGEAGSAPGGDAPTAGAVSFVKQVAPLLVSKCGRCHVNQQRGMFSMASFEVLMKGPPEGVVVFPGDPVGSRLAEVIESGDMPRGGGRVTPAEFDLLKKWIAEGARFDGPDPKASLTSYAAGAAPQEAMKVEVAAATGNEQVSFSRDIAPVLIQECANCHGYGDRPRARLNMTTFRRLLDGGDGGPPILPGNAAESLLLRKLQGKASGERMPLRRPPLKEEVIAQFETWINEGARFDGPDPTTDLKRVADLYRAQHSTHEELSAARAKLAEQNWRLGAPNTTPQKAETANFLILGNVGQNTLAEVGQKAEALTPQIGQIFKAPEGQPLIKGRMTLFVFTQRYDYSEFGQMVEKRELPREWQGHWKFDTLDAYGVVVIPRNEEYSLDTLLAQQIGAVYIASLGDSPHWFREGAGRVAASRLAADDPRVKGWNGALPAVLSDMSQPADFLQGKLPPEAADLASYSYVKFLMSEGRRFNALLAAFRRGDPFEQAFAQAYGGTPEQGAAVWVQTAVR